MSTMMEDPLGLDPEFDNFPEHDMLADNALSQYDEPLAQEHQREEQESPPVPTPNVASSQPSLRHISPSQAAEGNDYTMSNLTVVDGHGMWTSWTRVFDQPRYACLDLLDNCLDATLHPPDFNGRVVMKRLPPNGIAILNNSSRPIKSLKDVLVVYGSTKGVGGNAKRDAIGENGVGLKHGCATLSNTSFVLTRNHNVYSMGLIAKTLQTKQGVCLPSFEFVIEDADDKTPAEIEADLYAHLEAMIQQNPKIAKCVQIDLGQGDLNVGIKCLVEHCQVMWNDTWEAYDHVFQVLITSLIHTHDQNTADDPHHSRRAFQGNNPAAMFLQEIKGLLPKFYINIPLRGFEFYVENEKINFSYWQHRLVELTKFNVHIPKETPIQDLTHMSWDKEGYPLSIYCGFEALRVADRDQANAAHMYIYSRSSGRLITIDDDARASLSLAASGSDYQQGLTIIVDDIGAELPLMPTKQGIAWSEQRGGETHKRNLMAWAAGVAHCFWTHHAKTFQNRCKRSDFKTLLQNAVMAFADPIKRHLHDLEEAQRSGRFGNNQSSTLQLAMERLEVADLTHYRDITWKKQQNRSSKKWKILKQFGIYNKLDIVEGSATLFKFTDEHYPKPPPEEPKPTYQMPAAQAAQIAVANAAADDNLPATKKRKLSGGNAGFAANQPILLLDDDDNSGGKSSGMPAPSPVVPSSSSRIRARKSTGAPSPHEIMNGVNPAPNANPQVVEMQRRLSSSLAELERQKQLMIQAQLQHRDQMIKTQQELQRLMQENRQLQQKAAAGALTKQAPPPNYQEEIQKAQDELTILRRTKTKLQEDLREIKDQRATEVSGLNLEIEGLRLKLEQQDEMIRKLRRESNSPVKVKQEDGLTTRGNLLNQQGTDSI